MYYRLISVGFGFRSDGLVRGSLVNLGCPVSFFLLFCHSSTDRVFPTRVFGCGLLKVVVWTLWEFRLCGSVKMQALSRASSTAVLYI